MALKDKYFTISEAARQLGVTRQTVSRWIGDSRLAGERIGRETLIKKADVYEYQKKRIVDNAAREIVAMINGIFTDYLHEKGYIDRWEYVTNVDPQVGYSNLTIQMPDGSKKILGLTKEQFPNLETLAAPQLAAYLKDFTDMMRRTLGEYRPRGKSAEVTKGGRKQKE